ncbi:MAG: hypothetical protein NZ960_08585, partial [Candidatus Kapabacteria bacterium]|nr:hypothetical protein [Candidatus Kapabacteria bacterium]
GIEELKVVIQILEPKRLKIVCEDLKKPLAMILEEEENRWFRKDEVETLAFKDVFEIEIPFEKISVKHEQDINLFIEILRDSTLIERAPSIGFIRIHIPTVEFEKIMWL